VGQNLTALGINLSIAQAEMAEEAVGPVRSRLSGLQALLDQTAKSIRNVIADLRPPMLDDYGLVAALRWYAEEFASRAGLAITVQSEEPVLRLAVPVEIALFRIAQEALMNVAKHARATRAAVTVEVEDSTVRLVIADDGIGFNRHAAGLDEHQGWGLLIMTERAQEVGGCCRIESHPGRGTRVIVEVTR